MLVIAFEKRDWRYFYLTTRSGCLSDDWVCVPVFFYNYWLMRLLSFCFSIFRINKASQAYDTIRANMVATVVLFFLKAFLKGSITVCDVLLALIAVPWGAFFLCVVLITTLIVVLTLLLTTTIYFLGL